MLKSIFFDYKTKFQNDKERFDQMDQIYLILIRPSFNGILVYFYD